MKFIKVIETFELFDDGMKIKQVEAIINLENIELIREISDGSLSIFLVGRDKAMKIYDKDSIKQIMNEIKINKKKKLDE